MPLLAVAEADWQLGWFAFEGGKLPTQGNAAVFVSDQPILKLLGQIGHGAAQKHVFIADGFE